MRQQLAVVRRTVRPPQLRTRDRLLTALLATDSPPPWLPGKVWGPHDFSGGDGPGQANALLRSLGFTVERKHMTSTARQSPTWGQRGVHGVRLRRVHAVTSFP
jgi:hypothetical protein